MMPTLVAAAGNAEIKGKLLNGYQAGEKTFKVHLDGYNLLPNLTGTSNAGEWPPQSFFAFVDVGSLGAVRFQR